MTFDGGKPINLSEIYTSLAFQFQLFGAKMACSKTSIVLENRNMTKMRLELSYFRSILV